MQIRQAARRPVVTIAPEATIGDAARLMDDRAVGALVLCEGDRLMGIVTDRDIVTRGVARGVPATARIDSMMSTDVVTLEATADFREAFAVFRSHAIRRIPIVEDGRVVAMVSADDLVMDVASDLVDLARPITAQVIFGHPEPAVPAIPGR